MRAHRIVAFTHAIDAMTVANRSIAATAEAKNRAAGRIAVFRVSRSGKIPPFWRPPIRRPS
ncbi:hypothetical protein CA830_31430, partial [Burkholderia multivorans]